jgi:hypothetical protein
MSQPDDIHDVRKEEERRSKRPVDAEQKKRIALLRRKFYEALRCGNKQQFDQLLIYDLGQKPGSPEYIRSWDAWKQYHGDE